MRKLGLLIGFVLLFSLASRSFSQTVQVNLSSGTICGDINIYGGALRNARPSGIAGGGDMYSLALKSDGTVWAWGKHDGCLLGDGSEVWNRTTPVQVVGPGEQGHLTNVVAIGTGVYASHSFAVKSDGSLWAWGANWEGQLGINEYGSRNYAVRVVGPGGQGYLTNVVAAASGIVHSIALKSDGTVWAWGGNYNAQVGPYGWNVLTPVQVKEAGDPDNLENVSAISAGWTHNVALKNDGTVWVWGSNYECQFGNGANCTGYTGYAQRVVSPDGQGYLTGIVGISAGYAQNLALKSDGTVWAWGSNEDGQLGDGTTENRTRPVQVVGPGGVGYLTNVVAIAAGAYHSLALKSDGTVWAWGFNVDGELGNGTEAGSTTPVQVVGPGGQGYLTNVVAIAGADWHSLALKNDGTVWAWGYNEEGQLGINSSGDYRTTPVQVLLDSPTEGYAVYSVNKTGKVVKSISALTNNQPTVNFLFSSDGSDWKKWNGSTWQSAELNAHAEGMSESSAESVTQQQWDALLGSSANFHIAAIIRSGGELQSLSVELETLGDFPDFNTRVYGELQGEAPHSLILAAEGNFHSIRDRNCVVRWDFGDGSPEVVGKRIVAHTFALSGNYAVTMRVEDDQGNFCVKTTQIVVSQPADITVRQFKVYYSNPYGRVPLKVTIKPVIGYLRAGERVVSNQWDINNESVAQNRSTLIVTFNSTGEQQVNFGGTTNYGKSLSGGLKINVNPNQLPQCEVGYQDFAQYGYTKFTANCTDPDGRVRLHSWDFGNGETSTSKNGFAHYTQSGSYNVTLKVTDDSGGMATFSLNASVTR
jgi:alpha-tubulin suppressor-like RCC1 family protein